MSILSYGTENFAIDFMLQAKAMDVTDPNSTRTREAWILFSMGASIKDLADPDTTLNLRIGIVPGEEDPRFTQGS